MRLTKRLQESKNKRGKENDVSRKGSMKVELLTHAFNASHT